MPKQLDIIKEALQKYNSYSDKWEKAYFDKNNGGFLVVEKERTLQGELNRQEKMKYDKEYSMCMVLAKNGYKIEYLKEIAGKYDIHLNDIPVDLKKTAGSGNIVKYAKKAVYKQRAKIVVFEFSNMTHRIQGELAKLKQQGITVKYFITGKNKVIDL
jgi:hypothetical protein